MVSNLIVKIVFFVALVVCLNFGVVVNAQNYSACNGVGSPNATKNVLGLADSPTGTADHWVVPGSPLSAITISPNDCLIFRWPAGTNHQVFQFDTFLNFTQCSFNAAGQPVVSNTGTADCGGGAHVCSKVCNLTIVGSPYFFGCPVLTHCQSGLKLQVIVNSALDAQVSFAVLALSAFAVLATAF